MDSDQYGDIGSVEPDEVYTADWKAGYTSIPIKAPEELIEAMCRIVYPSWERCPEGLRNEIRYLVVALHLEVVGLGHFIYKTDAQDHPGSSVTSKSMASKQYYGA